MPQLRGDQHQRRVAVGEGAHHSRSSPYLAHQPFQRVVGPEAAPVFRRQVVVTQGFVDAVLHDFGKIEVFYLPSYSPELNPDELLNADLKQRVTTAAPARNKRTLTRNASSALRSIQKQPQRIQNYFLHRDVSYAA